MDTIYNGLCYGCTGLTSVTIPNSVIHILSSAFYGCSSLTSISIPSSVCHIGDNAFYGCKGLKSIDIPNSVDTLGSFVFSYCALTSITVESNNPRYDSRDNCNAIIETATNMLVVGCQNTIIPRSVSSISSGAFIGCENLTSIFIPNTVTSIGIETYENNNDTSYYQYNPFEYCNGLSSIVVENGNPVYDSQDNCNAIIETITNTLIVGCRNAIIPNTVTTIGNYAFCYNSLTEIDIPNSVTIIDDYAFSSTGLTSVTIPSSVTAIGKFAFASSSSLENVILGNSLTTIADGAFGFCSSLTNIDIPNSVKKIGWYAFYGCTGLTNITIPNSVDFDLYDNYEYAQFWGCTGLINVTIGSGVTQMSMLFWECPNITSVTCLATTPPRCNSVQSYDENGNRIYYYNFNPEVCEQATLYVPAASLEAYQTASYWKNFQHIEAIPVMTGDVDGDGKVSIADVTDLIDMLLTGAISATDYPAADVDGDGKITIADVTDLIDILLTN